MAEMEAAGEPKGLLASLVAPLVKKFERASPTRQPDSEGGSADRRRQRSRSSAPSQQGDQDVAASSTPKLAAGSASGGGPAASTGNVNPLTGEPSQAAAPMEVERVKRKAEGGLNEQEEVDPLGAHMLGQPLAGRGAQPSRPRAERTELWRSDHKLSTANDKNKGRGRGKKAMTIEGMSDMQVLMAKHLLSVGLMAKVAKCVGVFSIDTEVDSCFQNESTKTTTALHLMLAPRTKAERRKAGMPPHAAVMEAMLDEGLRVCNDRHIESKVDGCRVVFIDYMATLPDDPKQRLTTLLDDWRYARWRSTYKQARAIFEIGISPIASPQAHKLLRMIIALLAQTVDGELRHGIAPKTQLELRLEQALKGLGAWTNYDN
jgi:hypothetical protein